MDANLSMEQIRMDVKNVTALNADIHSIDFKTVIRGFGRDLLFDCKSSCYR